MSDDEHMARVRSLNERLRALNERLRATEPGYQHGYKYGCIDTVERCVVSNAAERAVIEAAKAFYVERQEPDSGHSVEELTFWQAVRALLAAEKGE